MIQYVYFVSYWCPDGDHWAPGNAEVALDMKIVHHNQWKDIEKALANPGQKIFVSNFQFLRTEEVEESS